MSGTNIQNKSGRLWIEEGEQRRGPIAEVAPLIPVSQTYSFSIPDSIVSGIRLGQRVTVPIGRRARPVTGFVVGLDEGPWDQTLRPIHDLVDSESFLTSELIALGREMSEHYVCPLGQTLKALTPEAVRLSRGLKTVRYARLTACGSTALKEDARTLSSKRGAVLAVLSTCDGAIPVQELLDRSEASDSVLRAVVKKDWVTIEKRAELGEQPSERSVIEEPDYVLNEEQRQALSVITQQISTGDFGVTLLHGVSGSGKTEVYIHAMRRVLDEGRQAILLVPEIVLTTQLVGRLSKRFERVAVLHSGLSGSQRSVMWRHIATGANNVVIGTRSAVFAPCPNLGLICVDEEQETSYKNLQAPRFHVRDVAIMRARLKGIPVLLGSATPAVETFYHSEHRSEYRKVVIARRVRDRPLPKVHLIDMRDELATRKRALVVSEPMRRMMSETLERGEQAILLMNRRGMAHRIFCPSCKMRVTCPRCQVGLVAHRTTGESVCHYCLSRIPTPKICSNVNCREPLLYLGLGTQRVEDVLHELFPQARIARVDSDTMTHRDHYRQIVDDFSARKIDVLVGTQMIAKGLDFPFVSFVGVVDADATGLAFDFRAQERLFQLITQVAGRAGRADVPGRVVVQTAAPDIPALKYAANHDYEGFVREELATRKRVGLPPFRRLARIVLSHVHDATARADARTIAERILATIETQEMRYADVLGPNPCALKRLRGKYRHDMLVRTLNASKLRELMGQLYSSGALKTKSTLTVDVDPVAMN